MDKKILISIIIVALVAMAIAGYFVFQPSVSKPSPQIGRCGDGVCGPIEKQRGICPKDCKSVSRKKLNSFEECAKAGYPVTMSYPRQCKTPDGKVFVEGTKQCATDWRCTDWPECVDGSQTRICTDKNDCGTDADKPEEGRDCEIQSNEILDNLSLEKIDGQDNLEIYNLTYPMEEVSLNGYIIKPKGTGPFPAVVLNHGGYGSAYLFALGNQKNINGTQNFVGMGNGILFADNGYVVIAVDYTQKDLDKYNIGEFKEGWEPGASEENITRALKAIEILENLDYVDANKIIMMGNSMGGFLTVGVAQKTQKLKAAIVVVAGIKDGNPQNSADNVVEIISPPENLVKDIFSPLLLLNGEDDDKINIKYPKHLENLLNKYGKTYTAKIYSNIGHDLLRVKQDEIYMEMFNFLDKYIQ